MQFKFYKSSSVFWYLEWKRFCSKTKQKNSEVQTSNGNWRETKWGGGGWEEVVVVVVVGAWKGSGRWTETLDPGHLDWQTHAVTAGPPVGFLPPSAADLRRSETWHWLFTPPRCLYTLRYPCPPPRRRLYSLSFKVVLIVRGDIDFLRAPLLSCHPPPVYVMRSFLLLLRLRALLL